MAAAMAYPATAGRLPKTAMTFSSNNHRRDLIWRPLLRLFRRFLKKDALQIDTYERIRSQVLPKQGLLFC